MKKKTPKAIRKRPVERPPVLLRKLLALAPGGSNEHARLLGELEHALLRALKEGIRSAERFVSALSGKEAALELAERGPGRRRWRALLDGRRVLELHATANRMFQTAWVRYERLPEPPKLTPRQVRIDALQKAFYARYMDVVHRAYGEPPKRINASERTLLLVGDLEGGVNNGGFSTYLSNKGPRRARATVEALESIGAHKTARMLEQAMSPGITQAQLGRLDERFYKVPEDLAVLAIRKMTAKEGS